MFLIFNYTNVFLKWILEQNWLFIAFNFVNFILKNREVRIKLEKLITLYYNIAYSIL